MLFIYTKTINMKRILKITAIAFIMVLVSSVVTKVAAQYNDNNRDVSYQNFYDELSPHGQWVDYPGQGYVWVPDAGNDFRPYSTNGHWVWTDDYEWMWVSDYDWGWAPFHYGRWDNDPYYGWYWVPGYEWSPAWVAWRDGGDYYGWAPIRPGINISVNFNIGSYSPPYDFWCFAPRRYISSPYINRYYVDRGRNITIINQTTIIVNNYHYGGNYGFRSGPRRMDAERYTGRINPVRFRQSYTPGRTSFRGNEVSVYRPNVRQDNNRNFAPRQVQQYERREGSFRNNSNASVNNGNNGRTNNNMSNRGNNTPDRRDLGRRDDNANDRRNNVPDRRNMDRTRDNNRQFENGNDRRMSQPERNAPGNNNSNDRRFDRSDDRGNVPNNAPVRQPNSRVNDNERPQRQPQQMERSQSPRSSDQPRQFERKENNNSQPQQMERRQAPQQMERRQAPQQVERRQAPQQMERRQAPQQVERRQAPQQQPRQVERSNDRGRSSDDRGNSGNDNKKRKF